MNEREYEYLCQLVKIELNLEEEKTIEKIKSAIEYHIENLRRKKPELSVTSEEIKKITAEMEYFYNTKISVHDSVIYGNVQKKPTWWTEIKDNKSNYYWKSYEDYLISNEKLPKPVKDRIGERADTVMNHLFNPLNNKNVPERKYGMVIGSVQSGKTANYTALICKAADAGFKIIIVIAGTTAILRQQTQIRIDKSFVGKVDIRADEKNIDPVFQQKNTVSDYRSHMEEGKMMPITMTSEKINGDFNKNSKNALNPINLHNTTAPLIFVIKKNVTVLNDIVEWAKKQDKSFPLLLIDDEADNASVNTQKDYRNNQTAINKGIRQILEIFPKRAYVGFTATPFANVFIDPLFDSSDDEKDLFPKDFILSLQSPDNYLGPKKIFGESGESEYIIPLPDVDSEKSKNDWGKFFPVKQKKDVTWHNVTEIPFSLKKAIAVFIFNIAIRNRRGFSKKHNTMLIHVSRLIDMHNIIAKRVEEYLKKMADEIRSCYKLPQTAEYSEIIKPLENLFNKISKDRWNSDESSCRTCFSDILYVLPEIIDSVEVGTANTNINGIKYSQDYQTNMIAIGGNALARGFTLPNLSISYFIRNTSMCDTLLQMGRWFGYRNGYEDLCRVFIPDTYASNFAAAYMASEDLIDCINKMEQANKTPEDFLITISQHPATRMMLTAKNKMRNAAYDKGVFLDGQLMEKGTCIKNRMAELNYISEVDSFISDLEPPEKIKIAESECYRWMTVPAEKIAKLIESCPEAFNVKINSNLIVNYIRQNSDFCWRVVIPSINSREESNDGMWKNSTNAVKIRKMKRYDKNSSDSETYSFSVSDKKSERMGLVESELQDTDGTRKSFRKARKNPLLIISIADLFESDNKYNDVKIEYGESFPFFSLSFAGDFNSPLFKPLMNFTYNQAVSDKLNEELISENETDDYFSEGNENA